MVKLVTLSFAQGITADARLFRASSSSAPGLLVLPAMGVNARSYDRLADALAERGITTLVAEHRGGDSSSVRAKRGVDYGYAELLADTSVHAAELRRHTSGSLSLLGHSLGGQLGTVGLAHWHQPGGKLIVIGSGTVHYRAWSGLRALGVFVGTRLSSLVAKSLDYYPGHRLGFGGLQGRSLIVDWAHAARTGEFRSSTTQRSLEVGLEAAQLEVLAVHVTGDTMAPRRATELLVGKLPGARVTWLELQPPAQPRALNPHFRWLKEPERVAEHLADFLSKTS